jgi:hypothetical protein
MGNAGELNVRTAPGTVSSGTSGQVLTSGGPGAGVSWATAASGQLQTELFTAPGTWTKPASCTQVRVSVVGGGGGGGFPTNIVGGNGGFVQAICPVSSPVSITIGAGGAGGPAGSTNGSGSTTSFGALVSCTGGTGGGPTVSGTPGTGTISVGTALRNNFQGTDGTILVGNRQPSGSTPAIQYSITGPFQAGAGGGATNTPAQSGGGTGGAVVVEFVG